MKCNLIKWFVIPFSLLCLWFCLSFWYILIFDQSLLVISYNHSANNFSTISHTRLLAGERLSGDFIAKDNNLGAVAMRFKSFQRIPYSQEDTLVFRLKEKGQKAWYYENKYQSGLTFDVPFLPFGFPIIDESKGKEYIFELESLKGNVKNGVVLSTRDPFLVSKYKENKSEVLSNPKELVSFVFKKFFNSFNTIDILYSSFIFTLPFLFYIFWVPLYKYCLDPLVALINRRPKKRSDGLTGYYLQFFLNYPLAILKYFFASFVVFVVFIDIIYLQTLNYLLYIVVVSIWIIILRKYQLKSKNSLFVGIFILFISPIALSINNNAMSEQAGAWAFMFLAGGLLMELLSNRDKKIHS